jgi:transcriptional regulator with XRE-family HTH domain
MRANVLLMPIVTRTPISGDRLRELREQAGLSQNDLAQMCTDAGCPVTQSQISRLEAGLHQPYIPLLRALAGALSVEVGDLLAQPAQLGRAS